MSTFDFSIIFNDGVAFYVIPFILVFAIIYGILSKTKIFAKQDPSKPNDPDSNIPPKNFYMIISLAFAFLASYSMYNTIGNNFVSFNLNNTFRYAIPYIIFIAVGLILTYILMAVGSVGLRSPHDLFSKKINIFGFAVPPFGLIFVALFITTIIIFSKTVYNVDSGVFSFLMGDFFTSVLLPIGVFIGLVAFITKSPNNP